MYLTRDFFFHILSYIEVTTHYGGPFSAAISPSPDLFLLLLLASLLSFVSFLSFLSFFFHPKRCAETSSVRRKLLMSRVCTDMIYKKIFPTGGREFLFREGSFSVLRFEATIAITSVEFGTSLKTQFPLMNLEFVQ